MPLTTPTEDAFAKRLLHWFDQHGRKDLPWQHDTTAYRVWLSEIMLQQTQVSTVIPYYQRMTNAYPNVQALAAAPLDEVLHHWTGLGYYARARNLHKTAQTISTEHDGIFPDSVEQLQALPGIGRSTAGAICAIAHHRHCAILDGNVKRVLARHSAIAGWPGKTAVAKQLWDIAESHTPAQRTGDYTQAIMDLGATVCTRSKPACTQCPVSTDCQAFIREETQHYPGKKAPKAIPVRQTLLLIIRNQHNKVLLQQRPPSGIWGGLWSFPECPDETELSNSCERVGVKIHSYQLTDTLRHTFSHFHLDYTPVHIRTHGPATRVADSSQRWVNPAAHGEIGLPAPILALLKALRSF
ncbi:MAG: A/G-specific adenine glycosylase [Gammaproteobacteria bacterium]|nr:A/G-specific adenine glycosylase [Gammaproteobacteria bacterium]MBQ0840106.1 A/G-specific adenine glycosylase [Gammaproteobacteria bacterium]